jgi:cytochrome c-type biogenesis protein CcmH
LIWIILVAVVVVIGGSWLVAKSMRTRAVVFVAALLAVGGYAVVGKPNKPDLPLSGRIEELEQQAKKTPENITPDQIMAIAERRSKEHPKDPQPHYIMGVLLKGTGKPNEAMLAFESALRRDPKFVPAMVALADLLFESGDVVTADAQRLYQEAFTLQPADLRLGYMTGVGDWQAGKKDEAEKLWASLDARATAGDKTLEGVANDLFSVTGKIEPYTMEFYQKVVARDPANLRAGYMLGIAEWQAGREAEAKARWAALTAKAPKGDGTVKALANDLFKASGRVDPWTSELFRLAYQQNPEDVQVGYFYGIGQWQAGHHAEADALWAAIEAKTDPNDPRRQMFAALKEAFRKETPATNLPAAPAPPGEKSPG